MPPAKRASTSKTSAASARRGAPAKASAAKPRTSTASSSPAKPTAGGFTPATRRSLELASKRLEKALGDAGDALQALGKDGSRGAKQAYKDLGKGLKVLQRDVVKTNKILQKDLEQLVAAVKPSKPAAQRATAAKRTPAGTPRSAGSKSKPAA